MKRILLVLILLGLLTVGVRAIAENYLRAEFISAEEAAKKWGEVKFEKDKFRTGKNEDRAKMVAEAIRRQVYVGKNRSELRKDLGDPDSYFFSDTIYSYKIGERDPKSGESWQLVFIPDEELKKIKEVKIHKKCCYKDSP